MIDRSHELDVDVARRVFGFWLAVNPVLPEREEAWYGHHSDKSGGWVYASCALPRNLFGHSYRYSDGLPKFSTDNDAAMTIVAEFARRHVNVSLYTNHGGRWYCFFGPTPSFDRANPFKVRHEACERTMPEAICRAALLAIDLGVVPWTVPQQPAPADPDGGDQ